MNKIASSFILFMMSYSVVVRAEYPQFNQKQLEFCADVAAEQLHINSKMLTDPDLLADILEHDMHLFDMPETAALLADNVVRPYSMAPMLAQIKEGITKNHSNLGTFLCLALEHRKLFSEVNDTVIKRTLHHMYLLDIIVDTMAHNSQYMKAVRAHVNQKVDSLESHTSFLGRLWDLYQAVGLFGVAKAKTMDWVVSHYETIRDQTWSLAFIIGNLRYLNMLYPKLLIPQILLAKPEDYLFRRELALWLSLKFYLMSDLKKEDSPELLFKNELADLVGKLNRDYAGFLEKDAL